MKLSESRLRPYPWIFLCILFVALAAGVLLYNREEWQRPALVAGEATYLMQAESLAQDLDLAYTRQDFLRTHLTWHGEPPDLELASGSGGRRITYDRPFAYALWLAPFLRFWPETGFAVANFLLLVFTGLCAVAALETSVGVTAPFWVAIFLFASVTWSYVWLATGDLFLFAVVVIAMSLLVLSRARHERLTGPERKGLSPAHASMIAGALLALPLATEPLYGVLALGAFFAVPPNTGRPTRSAYLMGMALCLLAVVVVQWWSSGGLHFFATARFRFTPETGFPLVDFVAADWSAEVRRFQALYWDGAPRFSWGVDPLLWLWNGVYVTVGRHIGLLPYFLPLVLLMLGGGFRGYRRAVAVASGIWLSAMIVLHPFNVYGGEGAVANRLFLPVYGALWFVLARRVHLLWGVATAVLSSLFLWNLWTSPWTYPPSRSGGYAYVTPVAQRWLPFEASQRRIPSNQQADHLGLKLRLLNDAVWVETRSELVKLDENRHAKMVIASPVELPFFDLEFDAEAPGEITLRGGRLEEKILRPDGGISFRVHPWGLIKRHHAMWWTPARQWVYPLEIEMRPAEKKKSLAFQIYSERLLSGSQ